MNTRRGVSTTAAGQEINFNRGIVRDAESITKGWEVF